MKEYSFRTIICCIEYEIAGIFSLFGLRQPNLLTPANLWSWKIFQARRKRMKNERCMQPVVLNFYWTFIIKIKDNIFMWIKGQVCPAITQFSCYLWWSWLTRTSLQTIDKTRAKQILLSRHKTSLHPLLQLRTQQVGV